MTAIAALNDRGQWGNQVCLAASKRGWNWQLFDRADQVGGSPGYAFLRVHQHPTWRTAQDKREAEKLVARGWKPIPDWDQVRLYEDKLAQSLWLPMQRWMPATVVARSIEEAVAAARQLGLPLISKSAAGSASAEVRLLRTAEQVESEIASAFTDGIAGRYAKQQGYVIFQEFLAENGYDYRVCAIGRQRMMLRRHNRPDRPFASGSGKWDAITELDSETRDVLDLSNEFFAAIRTTWCGIDLVQDKRSGQWKVLEVTLAWTQKAYAECSFFGTTRKGAEIWDVLLDEIEAGTFG